MIIQEEPLFINDGLEVIRARADTLPEVKLDAEGKENVTTRIVADSPNLNVLCEEFQPI